MIYCGFAHAEACCCARVSCDCCVPRLTVFKATLLKLFKEERAQSLELERVKSFVNEENVGSEFSSSEIMAAIDKMSDDNQIMLADNVIFLI